DLSYITDLTNVVYVHGAWLPILWRAARRARTIGARLIVRPAGSYDPLRLAYHRWRKRLVGPFEHWKLKTADLVLAACPAEAEWIRAYEPEACRIEVVDLKHFFNLSGNAPCRTIKKGNGHFLYLGRRHPLKGIEYLEEAIRRICAKKALTCDKDGNRIELRVVSNAFGDEKEKIWEWCDTLVLPTLSENFGRVVAEALERGKRVITTDGAPAWGDGLAETDASFCTGYDGRLIFLKGYRAGTREKRVDLLITALEENMKQDG
ncbi:MAG: hypothetical protein J6U40_08010, partial [Kiritimatiellae bacterium]|nr:hypothetical protein [Kiritimatiellia bacterium]